MDEDSQRELAEETARLLPRLVRILKTSMADHIEMVNIPYGQLRVLSHLYQHDRSTVGEVATGIGVSLATASELIDRQVETGWIERGINPADRRQVILTLSSEAREVFQRVHTYRTAQIHLAFDRLTPEDRSAFVRGLRELVVSLDDPIQPAEIAPFRHAAAQ